MIRLFIAVELPDSAKQALLTAGSRMGQTLPTSAVRWVKPEQLHLTLRFLGDTAVSQLPSLAEQLNELASHHRPLTLRLDGTGAFPNRKRPRVVWAGLAGQVAGLQVLQADLEDRVVALGWSREKRPFSPHITLGRVKDSGVAAGLDWTVKLEVVEFEVLAVKLVQSELRPSGPVYTVRHEALL